jgi:hypothetical protein
MISSIDLSKLRNAEYIQFINGFLAIILANNPTALLVQAPYNQLQSQLSGLEIIFVTEQGSALTEEITALDARRDRAVTGIALMINAFTYHFNSDTAKQAETLKKLLEKYGSGIARENYQAETAIIDSLLADLDSKTEMADALNALQMTNWAKEMQLANTAFNTAYLQRTQQLGAASKETLQAKRAETNNAYYKLRNFINSYYTINEGAAPYGKTSNELNALINQYNIMMAGRQSNDQDEPSTSPTS